MHTSKHLWKGNVDMNLYLDCGMGAAGDMLMSALYELLPEKKAFRDKMERLCLPGVSLEYKSVIKAGIKGTKISVIINGEQEVSQDVIPAVSDDGFTAEGIPATDTELTEAGKSLLNTAGKHDHNHDHKHDHNHDHKHDHKHDHDHDHEHDHDHTHGGHTHSHSHDAKRYSYNQIKEIISGLDLPDNVTENALGVYELLGHAEAKVHGVSLDKIHFHEVGSVDAIVDIVGCCIAMELLGVTQVLASPVHVGAGSVKCEHGILPVPAPATAEILKDVPIYGGSIRAELCTPTGAALLKRFVTNFVEMPPMVIKKIGYGMGTKDFERANCVRAFLTEGEESLQGGQRETMFEICCNLDDMTPEAVGAAMEILFENGAFDVFLTPILMKKNRQATLLTVLCNEALRDKLVSLILLHTSTIGVRIKTCRRDLLTREIEEVPTEYGNIRIKRARGFGVEKVKPEYDDIVATAKKHNKTFLQIYSEVNKLIK